MGAEPPQAGLRAARGRMASGVVRRARRIAARRVLDSVRRAQSRRRRSSRARPVPARADEPALVQGARAGTVVPPDECRGALGRRRLARSGPGVSGECLLKGRLRVAINAQLKPDGGSGGIVTVLRALTALARLEDGPEEYVFIGPHDSPEWLRSILPPGQAVVPGPAPLEWRPDRLEPFKRALGPLR